MHSAQKVCVSAGACPLLTNKAIGMLAALLRLRGGGRNHSVSLHSAAGEFKASYNAVDKNIRDIVI